MPINNNRTAAEEKREAKLAYLRAYYRRKILDPAYLAKIREENRIRAAARWDALDKATRSEINRKNRAKHLEDRRERCRQWRKDHTTEVAEYNRAYYADNKQRFSELNRVWITGHRAELAASRKKQYHEDVKYRTKVLLMGRLYTALNRAIRSGQKSTAMTKLVGCSMAELIVHLEAQFKEGMSWDRRGDFEIDHIRPLSTFDIRDPAQQREAFHFTNLQPLWPAENQAKNSKWEGLNARQRAKQA